MLISQGFQIITDREQNRPKVKCGQPSQQTTVNHVSFLTSTINPHFAKMFSRYLGVEAAKTDTVQNKVLQK